MERLTSAPLERPERTILSNTKIMGICNAKDFSGEAVLNLEFKRRELGLVGSGVALLLRYWYCLFWRILVRLLRGSAGHEAGREYEALPCTAVIPLSMDVLGYRVTYIMLHLVCCATMPCGPTVPATNSTSVQGSSDSEPEENGKKAKVNARKRTFRLQMLTDNWPVQVFGVC